MNDKANGVLVGAAIGDAMGMPREFSYVPGPVSGLVKGRLPAGSFTDDSEMMLALAESLVACGKLDPDDLVKRFVAWYHGYPADIGITTSRIVGAHARGENWQTVEARELRDYPNNAANGSLMRCFPVALADHDDLDACIRDTILQSRITHPHDDAKYACVVANTFIWWALRGADKTEALARALANTVDNMDVYEAVRYGIEPAPMPLGGGGAVVTLRAAIWSVMNHDNYADAVLTVVNNCGDPDTVGCVTGALAGALWGFDAIPQDWRDGLRGEWPLKSKQYVGTAYLLELTGKLLALGGA